MKQVVSINQEIKQETFPTSQNKANLNVLYTASWIYHRGGVMLKEYGLYIEQYNVLRILRGQKQKPISQKDILVRMLDKSSNLTRIITRLKTKQLIEVKTSDMDRREYKIIISDAGLELLHNIDVGMKDKNFLPNALNDEDAETLSNLLDKLRAI